MLESKQRRPKDCKDYESCIATEQSEGSDRSRDLGLDF